MVGLYLHKLTHQIISNNLHLPLIHATYNTDYIIHQIVHSIKMHIKLLIEPAYTLSQQIHYISPSQTADQMVIHKY